MGLPKIGIITQARMTSTRLPGKVLSKVKNKSLLKYHIDRLRWSKLPVFIATTVNETDNLIVNFAEEEEVPCYRGSEENVLSRYYECAKKFNLDIIIRVTSDCPLIDGEIIKNGVDIYLKTFHNNLYLSNVLKRTYPRGMDFEIFSFSLLSEAFHNAVEYSDLEHVTPYIHANKSGKVDVKHILNEIDESRFRITVDTAEDFNLVQTLIENFNLGDKPLNNIVKVLHENPELEKINAHIEQKKI